MMAASSRSRAWRALRGAGGAAVLLGLLAAPAAAEVIEIDSDGTATVYDRPMIFTAGAATPVEAPVPVRAAAGPQPFALREAERVHGLAPGLLEAVAWQESRGRMAAVSPKGALGIMQLMPGTAAELGVDPHDPADNIRGGALYLRRQIDRFGSVALGLAAYNAGPGAVLRYRGIPPFRETRDYVVKVLSRWRAASFQPEPESFPVEVPKL